MDYFCNGKSKISNVCNAVKGNYLQAMKIVHYHHCLFTHYLLIYSSIMKKVIKKTYGKDKNFKIHGVQRKVDIFTWASTGPPAHATFLFSIGVFYQQLRT